MNKKQKAKVTPSMTLFSAVILVGAFTSTTNAQVPAAEVPAAEVPAAEEPSSNYNCKPDEECVEIKFTAKGCPVEAKPPNFEVNNNKHIVWQSVNTEDNDIIVEYEIYFDPFMGQPHKSNGVGRIKRKIDETAPATPPGEKGIEYKYTISGLNCPDEIDKYHDPRFTVRK